MIRYCIKPTFFQQNVKILSTLSRIRNPQLCLSAPKIRQFANEPKSSGSLAKPNARTDVSTDVKPIGERIKENTKTVSYMGVIVLGVVVTGALFFAIFRELLSSSSSNNVYSAALDRCINEPKIQDALGMPIKGYGEETRRRRRTHVAHTIYERNGVKFMRMQFHIQGIRNKATVQLEMRENMSGNYEYRYLFAQLDHYPHTTIILEDNRLAESPPIGGLAITGGNMGRDSQAFKL